MKWIWKEWEKSKNSSGHSIPTFESKEWRFLLVAYSGHISDRWKLVCEVIEENQEFFVAPENWSNEPLYMIPIEIIALLRFRLGANFFKKIMPILLQCYPEINPEVMYQILKTTKDVWKLIESMSDTATKIADTLSDYPNFTQ